MASAIRTGHDSLGRYLAEITKMGSLPEAGETVLAKKTRQGDKDARNQLVQSLLLFAVSVAKGYQGRGLTLSELISAGNLGLITAAERFDEAKGFKFISYAVWWIRQGILQAIADHSRDVRLPLNRSKLLQEIYKIEARLRAVYGHATTEQIAAELELAREEIESTLIDGQAIASLDAPFPDRQEQNLYNTLPDLRQERPDIALAKKDLFAKIAEAMALSLDAKELDVLVKFLGLNDEPPMTLAAIGRLYHVGRERVRQIKDKALDKLRHPDNAELWEALQQFFSQ